MGGVRYPTLQAALAVPLILGLSALGLQRVLELTRDWPSLTLMTEKSPSLRGFRIPVQAVLLVPLVWGLRTPYDFSAQWYGTKREADSISQVVHALKTDSLQWVSAPFGFHDFLGAAVAEGLKVSPEFNDVQWRDREYPKPKRYVSFDQGFEGMQQTGVLPGVAAIFAIQRGVCIRNHRGGSDPLPGDRTWRSHQCVLFRSRARATRRAGNNLDRLVCLGGWESNDPPGDEMARGRYARGGSHSDISISPLGCSAWDGALADRSCRRDMALAESTSEPGILGRHGGRTAESEIFTKQAPGGAAIRIACIRSIPYRETAEPTLKNEA